VTGSQPTQGLVDTNVLIHLARLDPLDELELPDEIVISTVTLAELSAGPHHATDPAERARRINLLQHAEATFEPLPFDAVAARTFGQVSAAVVNAGRQTRSRFADLMIASIAISNELPLYTFNADDFVGLADLLTVVSLRLRRSNH
jgi:predicted nucleic acid-binding protein